MTATLPRNQGRADSETLSTIRDELHEHVAAQTVGAPNVTDSQGSLQGWEWNGPWRPPACSVEEFDVDFDIVLAGSSTRDGANAGSGAAAAADDATEVAVADAHVECGAVT